MSKSSPTFSKGGIHPRESKELTEHLPIEAMPPPEEVDILLLQHFGSPCRVLVDKKATVMEGETIGVVDAGLGASVHSSVSGTVKSIGASPHPVRVEAPSVTIRRDPRAEPRVFTPSEWEHLSPEELLEKLRNAGLVGLGGAGFPTHLKLSPPPGTRLDKLILNAAECEPYLNCDNRTMIEFPHEILTGARIILRILGIKECHIGIENNKQKAIWVLSRAAAESTAPDCKISVNPLMVKYPQGSEKQLIQTITGRRVPYPGLPFDVGVMVINVGTAKTIYDAVVLGKPLYERVVTISGRAIARPANLMVRIGTRLSDIVTFLGGTRDNLARIVVGGPMMGFSIPTTDLPVMKTTSGVLFLSDDEIDSRPHGPCIRCGRCVEVCSMGLSPNEVGIYVEAGRARDTAQFGVFECFECGACAFVCPAKRPLVQFTRLAKAKARK